jgi:hypothetical protein
MLLIEAWRASPETNELRSPKERSTCWAVAAPAGTAGFTSALGAGPAATAEAAAWVGKATGAGKLAGGGVVVGAFAVAELLGESAAASGAADVVAGFCYDGHA